jgi:hypothetical protein
LKVTLELLAAPFIVLDALDECSSWGTLFEIIEEMHSWRGSTLRVLLTSRKEVLIEEALEDIILLNDQTCLKSHLVDKDIETYVHERLAKEKSFKTWRKDKNKDVQEKIEKTLGQGAHGMYNMTLMPPCKYNADHELQV